MEYVKEPHYNTQHEVHMPLHTLGLPPLLLQATCWNQEVGKGWNCQEYAGEKEHQVGGGDCTYVPALWQGSEKTLCHHGTDHSD